MNKVNSIISFLLVASCSIAVNAKEYITVVMEDGNLIRVHVSHIKQCNSQTSVRSSNRNPTTSWPVRYYTDIKKIVSENDKTALVITNDGKLCSANKSSMSHLNNFEAPATKIFDINNNKVKDALLYP